MSIHALVVDDEEEIVRSIREVIESLGHTCADAGNVEGAWNIMQKNDFDYLVLDMNLPMNERQITTRRENGRNLLERIRKEERLKTLPVIVVTGHSPTDTEFAVSIIRTGGSDCTDYINKPIAGDKLDNAIKTMLEKCGVSQPMSSTLVRPATSQPFTGGTLYIVKDGAYLDGCKIISDKGYGYSLKMLNVLCKKRNGKFVCYDGQALAKKISDDDDIGRATGCVRQIRNNACKRLLERNNLTTEPQDIIVRDEQGYHLNDDKIIIGSGKPPEIPCGDTSNVPTASSLSEDTPATSHENVSGLSDRQKWILSKARDGGLSREEVEGHFGVAGKTAKRDLKDLSDRGLIQFVRAPRPGRYVMK